MRKYVRRRHNKDGSVTKTTTYSYKNIFGTRVVDTYTERSKPKSKAPRKERKQTSPMDLPIVLIIAGIIFGLWFLSAKLIGGVVISVLVIVFGVYLLLPANWHLSFVKDKPIPQAVKTENGWICPECKTENSNSAASCKGCGRYK